MPAPVGVVLTSLLAARPEAGRAKDTAGVRVIRALFARGILLGTVRTAQLPALYAATAPDAEHAAFCGPGGQGHLGGPPERHKLYGRLHGTDEAHRVWERSEELPGVRIGWSVARSTAASCARIAAASS